MTAHVPNYRQKYVNAYGLYSNKSRGVAAKSECTQRETPHFQEAPAEQKAYRKTWAMLIRQVWEVDPLVCTKCGGEMKVVDLVVDQDSIRRALAKLEPSAPNTTTAATGPPRPAA